MCLKKVDDDAEDPVASVAQLNTLDDKANRIAEQISDTKAELDKRT